MIFRMTESLEPITNMKSSKKRRNLRTRGHLISNTSIDAETEDKVSEPISFVRNCASEGSISSDREDYVEVAYPMPQTNSARIRFNSSNIPGSSNSAAKFLISSHVGSAALASSRLNHHSHHSRLRKSDSEESMTAVALSRLTLRTGGTQLPVESDSFHEGNYPMKPTRRRRKHKRILIDKEQPPSPSSSLLVNTSECDSFHQVYEMTGYFKDILDESSSCDNTIKRHAQKERNVASLSTSSTVSGSSMAGVWRSANSPGTSHKVKPNPVPNPFAGSVQWPIGKSLLKSAIPTGSKRKSSASVGNVLQLAGCSNLNPIISSNSSTPQESTLTAMRMSDYDQYCLMLEENDDSSLESDDLDDDDLMETNLSSHSSLTASKSVDSEEDLGAVTDRGQEGDDEQSDFFHESNGGPTFGVVPWWHISYNKKFKSLMPEATCAGNKTCLLLKKRRKDTQHWVTLQRYWSMYDKNHGSSSKSRCETVNKRRNRAYKTGCRRLLGKSRQFDSVNSSSTLMPDTWPEYSYISTENDSLVANGSSDMSTPCADPSTTPTPEQSCSMEEQIHLPDVHSCCTPAADVCKRQRRTTASTNTISNPD